MDEVLIIFQEALLTRLLPFYNEVMLTAILHFWPTAQYIEAALVAAAGSLTGAVILYGVGIWLRRMPEKVSTPKQQERVMRMQKDAGTWLPWLLVLAPTPFGTALIMAAGFFRMRPWIAGSIVTASEILWRVSPLIGSD